MESPATRKAWYVELFENYGVKYDAECFTQGTLGECDFIEREIGHDRGRRILDVGCGTGRHSLELARRGYSVVGVDLSEGQLKRAGEKADDLGVYPLFMRQDARNLPFSSEFDVAIMLCEGGFSLMETDEMNVRILEGIHRALKTGGTLIFTALNALFPLYHSVKDFLSQGAQEGTTCSELSFDLMTFRENNVMRFTDDSGKEMELRCNERYYVPSEITWILTSLGFTDIGIFGAHLGAFSRQHQLTPDDFELLVVARKASG